MDKGKFSELVTNYSSLTNEEKDWIIALEKEYPYSQIIHILAARAAKDFNTDRQDHHLHLSAIYSTDRLVLKNIITAPRQSRISKEKERLPESIQQSVIEIRQVIADDMLDISGDELIKEVAKDISLLKKLKLQFEDSVEQFQKAKSKPDKKAKSEDTRTEEGLIQEIKSSKKKIKTADPKQKEQIEIIDQFIKTQPSIGKIKPGQVKSQPDLSEGSALFGENIVSETLVELLIKQGKKDKAIDVLKKLIWKFPQKKAYFAAQIADLKK